MTPADRLAEGEVEIAILDKHGPCWWIAERDPVTGRKRRVEKCYTDRRISAVKLADWNRTRAAGEVGMLDQYAEHRHRPLMAHLAEYIADMVSRRRDPEYVDTTNKRLAKLFKECRWGVLSDINADGFRRWREKTPAENVTTLDGRKRKQTIRGATTLNQYLAALKAFCTWARRRMSGNRWRRSSRWTGPGMYVGSGGVCRTRRWGRCWRWCLNPTGMHM